MESQRVGLCDPGGAIVACEQTHLPAVWEAFDPAANQFDQTEVAGSDIAPAVTKPFQDPTATQWVAELFPLISNPQSTCPEKSHVAALKSPGCDAADCTPSLNVLVSAEKNPV